MRMWHLKDTYKTNVKARSKAINAGKPLDFIDELVIDHVRIKLSDYGLSGTFIVGQEKEATFCVKNKITYEDLMK